jgi:hypothetical protein
MVAALRRSEAKSDLTQSIRMYGIRNARNLLTAFRLAEVTGAPLIQFHPKTGLPTIDPANVLRYAVRTAAHFGEGSRNEHQAFSAGLVLDLMGVLAEAAGARKSAVRNYIDTRYGETLRRIDKCLSAGKAVQNLVLERHITSTLLLGIAGDALLAILYPDYLELRRKCDKKRIGPILQHVVELREYDVSRNLMAALIAQVAPGLEGASWPALFLDYPYLLPGLPRSRDAQDLVELINTV